MTSAVTVPPNLMAKKRQRETKKTRDKVLKNLHFSIGDRSPWELVEANSSGGAGSRHWATTLGLLPFHGVVF